MIERYILAPDSFKGTLKAIEVCDIMQSEIQYARPDAEVISLPVADGGEGTVDAFLTAVGGTRVKVSCHGPYLEEITGFYGLLLDHTAVIEMAAAAGLPLAGDRLEPDQSTTYGVGELVVDAAQNGANRIILGLGGSATNDGGCGAAAALGVRFLDESGKEFLPTGGTLNRIARIDISKQKKLPEIIVMCDIDNPLCGSTGASAIFGPQKGASPDMIKHLDAGLLHLANIISRDLGKEILEIPGAGAAGGMGGGAAAFWNARLQMGVETVLDVTGFDDLARDAKLIITGEGRLDRQSVRGKIVSGVARRAKFIGVPVIAVVGSVGEGAEEIYRLGVQQVFPTVTGAALSFQEIQKHCRENLHKTMRQVMKIL